MKFFYPAFCSTATIVVALLNPTIGVSQTTDLHPAVNHPDQFARELFIQLKHPADLREERGVPDRTKTIGDTGPKVWETWKLARMEVFLPNGCKPPEWDVAASTPGPVASQPALLQTVENPTELKFFDHPKFSEDVSVLLGVEVDACPLSQPNLSLATQLSPAIVTPTVDVQDLGNETRMNRADGQEDFLRRGLAIDSPRDSIEVKAAWRLFSERELDPQRTFEDVNGDGTLAEGERGLALLQRRFYVSYGLATDEGTQQIQTKPFGLVGLHIITKDIPNWFWATFEHASNPNPEVGSLDRYSPADTGFPREVAGTIWENYRLRGTQVDFVDAAGRPTTLANTQIEGGFQASSSCITCHARTSIGQRLDNIFARDGQQLFGPGTFISPSGSISRPPSAPNSYTFGANRLTVFEDIHANRAVPTLPAGDVRNLTRQVSRLTGAIGAPDPELFALEGTPRAQYTQLDFVWSLRRAFRHDTAALVPMIKVLAAPQEVSL
ncbi:hypothetical protein GOB27_14565 [Sinorhizobium meliloti]|nr:hypothetical protein [Sinorhizobium meliloti]